MNQQQFRDFSVVGNVGAVNTTVYAALEFGVELASGTTFAAQEALTWPAAAGTCLGPIRNGKLRIIRSSGPTPSVGTTITGPSATALVVSKQLKTATGRDMNPPLFQNAADTSVQGGVSANDLLITQNVSGEFLTRKITAVPSDDRLTVASSFSASQYDPFDVPGFIVRNFSENKLLPLPFAGDAGIGQYLQEAFTILDDVDPIGEWQTSHSFGTNWQETGAAPFQYRLEHGRVILDGAPNKSVALSAPETILTLPSGYRPEYEQFYGEVNNNHVIKIETDGDVRLHVAGSGTTIHLENLSFVAA